MSDRYRERDRARRWVCPQARVDRSGPGEADWVADAVRAQLRGMLSGGAGSSRAEVDAFVRAGQRAVRRRRAWFTALLVPLLVGAAVAGLLLGSAL